MIEGECMKVLFLSWPVALLVVLMSLASSCVGPSGGYRGLSYELVRSGDLVATNSVNFFDENHSSFRDGLLKVHFAAVVKNTSSTRSHHLELSKAVFDVQTQAYETPCKHGDQSAVTLDLEPKQSAYIQCYIGLSATEKNQLSTRDTVGVLTLPVRQSSPLVFQYLLSIEMFQ